MSEVDRLAEAAKLAEHFPVGTVSLYDIVERILEKQSGTDRVLIVVDQFEELYTLAQMRKPVAALWMNSLRPVHASDPRQTSH